MSFRKKLATLSGYPFVMAAGLIMAGCNAVTPPAGDTTTVGDGDKNETSSARVYESAGGTSDLSFGAADNGAATLTSFDPGAFVVSSSGSDSGDGSIAPAQTEPPPPDDGATAPPPDDGGSEPPPPDDGTVLPPPDDGTEPLPPDDGTLLLPPDDGTEPPPPDDGTLLPPPDDGTEPPPPDDGTPLPPPDDGTFTDFDPNLPPPDDGFFFPPPDSFDGALLPPPDGFEFADGYVPPPDGFDGGSFSVPPPPDGFVGDGGFFAPPEGFDDQGIFFIPPEGFIGDAIFLPPPPEDFTGDGFFFPAGDGTTGEGFEAPADFFDVYNGFPPPPAGFEGEWQPPPPSEWDGSGDWVPPPADQLYADGEWYPPPPPLGWEGEWFAPPPPPAGLEEFPGEFFFSDTFDDFFSDDFFAGQGFEQGPPPFEEFPFAAFLADGNSIHEIIPNAPPEFVHGAFGDFQFGDLPPPPPGGFPPFPPPPEFLGGFGDFGAVFGPPPTGDGTDGVSPEFPPDLPPEFFEFTETLADLDAFLEGFDFPPPPDGSLPPGDGPFPPGDGELPALAFIDFEQIKEFLPDDFIPPEAIAEIFENFGHDHPLIGEGGVVNPSLEEALHDHPPIPEGFDGFDFHGDCPQFDDLFTVYDENNVGTTMRGQVNSTFSETLPDGMKLQCSDTTVVEAVQGAATPMVQMEEGVFQTQWVVNIRTLTNSMFEIEDPADPAATIAFEQAKETLCLMTWTMVIQEVDTDGDGVPDKILTSGSNKVEMLSETVEGDPPPGLPPIPPAPTLLLPFDFQGVLDLDTQPPPQ